MITLEATKCYRRNRHRHNEGSAEFQAAAARPEAGLETSFDSFDELTAFGFKQSKSEVNLGITPGGGAELFVNPNMSVFALGRIHIVSDHYVSMEFGAAYHFKKATTGFKLKKPRHDPGLFYISRRQ